MLDCSTNNHLFNCLKSAAQDLPQGMTKMWFDCIFAFLFHFMVLLCYLCTRTKQGLQIEKRLVLTGTIPKDSRKLKFLFCHVTIHTFWEVHFSEEILDALRHVNFLILKNWKKLIISAFMIYHKEYILKYPPPPMWSIKYHHFISKCISSFCTIENYNYTHCKTSFKMPLHCIPKWDEQIGPLTDNKIWNYMY